MKIDNKFHPKFGPIEIQSDSKTVWVNSASLLGRFGMVGIDIHRPVDEQSSKGECLHCTHGITTLKDWKTFQSKMKEFYGIDVSDEHRPERLNGPTCKEDGV